MCGLSVYVIGFNYKGYQFLWDNKQHCFTCPRVNLKFNTIPVGAFNLLCSREDPDNDLSI
jgi:hypothetical protein